MRASRAAMGNPKEPVVFVPALLNLADVPQVEYSV